MVVVTGVGGRPWRDSRSASTCSATPIPPRQYGDNDAGERCHCPVALPSAARATEDQDPRRPLRRLVGAPTRLVGFALLAGALAVGQMVRADDHWREGEIASTSLSIAVGTVSIGTDVEVSDLVIVNDDSKTSADLFLAIVAAQARAAGARRLVPDGVPSGETPSSNFQGKPRHWALAGVCRRATYAAPGVRNPTTSDKRETKDETRR